MGAHKLRYPSSGPYVVGAGGAPAEPGEGMVMRQRRVVGPVVELPDLDLVTQTVTLPACQPGMRYAARFEVHIRMLALINEAWATTGFFDFSLDNGASWAFFDQIDLLYNSALTGGGDRQGYNIDLCASSIITALPGHVERTDIQFRGRLLPVVTFGTAGPVGDPQTVASVQEVL